MVLGTLVGRARELTAFTAALEAAKDKRGSVHLITGEGGVGKTRLTAAVAEQARALGFTTVTGRAFPVETGIPYALFADGFVPLLRETPPATLQILSRGAANELGLLFPTLRGEQSPPARTLEGSDLKARLLDSFAYLLASLAKRQPLLVVLENLHWADPSSIDLFHFVARGAATHRLVLVATYNDAHPEQNRALRAAERSLGSIGALTRHPLPPLSSEETEALVRATFGGTAEELGDFAERVHSRTRGNPFFVEETLKALVQAGRLRRDGDRWVGWTTEQLVLPDSIRDALRLRYERLSAGAQQLAQLAAAVGTHVPHALLARLAFLEPAALVAAVEELLGERLIEETDGAAGPAYLFAHPMMQEMLYAELSRVRRSRLHGEIAEALEAEYGERALLHAEELAVHFRRADSAAHRARAVRYLAVAGRTALERGASREAAEGLQAALDLLGPGGDAATREEVLGSLARARHRLGEYETAAAIWRELRAAAETRGDVARIATLERRLGVAAARRGAVTEALAHFDGGLAAAERSGDRAAAASLLLARGAVLLDVGRGGDAGTDIRRALTIAEGLGDARLRARVHQALQSFHVWQGPPSAAREQGDLALKYAAESGDARVAWSATWTHALHCGLSGDAPGTARYLEEARRLADEARSPVMRLWTAEVEIEYRSGIGRWDDALLLADRTIDEARAFGQRLLLPRLLTWSAMIHLGRGDFETAKPLVQEAWQLSGADDAGSVGTPNVHSVVPAHVALGYFHYYRDEWRTALDIGERGLAIADRTGYTVWAVYRILPLVAECHLRLYDWEGARAAAARLRDAGERLGHPLALAWADACDAFETRFLGDRPAAIARLRAAAEALEAIPYAEHAARLRRRLAEPFIEIGDREGARDELHLAYAAFSRLGARLALSDIKERLHDIGFKPPVARPARTGLASLTPTEVDVARLVAKGRRDKEIAEELGQKARTVGTHLRNIYRKLEMHRRSELADWAREHLP